MDSPTFPCAACGAPNYPAANRKQISCDYCGANIQIPLELRFTQEMPQAEKKPATLKQAPAYEQEAGEVIRKAQPFLIRLWNIYAAWTWIRWVLPGCLMLIIIGIILCFMLGAIPLLVNFTK